ncbi:hypothetical protein HMI01_13150 [Halolactibacillus miurensis]|uniref:Uncharacterized protein n=1 Tax=Halolactibacillus miurensis TaxID=306541 RepID=A0ABQ0VT50_9BACI|nr:hypothetical protein HMI01_13150 [Halolactibacillus miurensis]
MKVLNNDTIKSLAILWETFLIFKKIEKNMKELTEVMSNDVLRSGMSERG